MKAPFRMTGQGTWFMQGRWIEIVRWPECLYLARPGIIFEIRNATEGEKNLFARLPLPPVPRLIGSRLQFAFGPFPARSARSGSRAEGILRRQ